MKPIKSIAAYYAGCWKTSMLGLVLFVATVISVFKVEGVNWTDALLPILFSMGLLLMPKETKSALKGFISKKSAAVVALLILATACQRGPSTSAQVPTRTTTTSTTKIQTPVEHQVQADSAQVKQPVAEMQPGQVYAQESNRAKVSASIDALGQLTANCHCKEEVFRDTVTHVVLTSLVAEQQPCPYDHGTKPATEKQAFSPAAWIWRNLLWPFAILIAGVTVFLVSALFLKHLALHLFTGTKGQ